MINCFSSVFFLGTSLFRAGGFFLGKEVKPKPIRHLVDHFQNLILWLNLTKSVEKKYSVILSLLKNLFI